MKKIMEHKIDGRVYKFYITPIIDQSGKMIVVRVAENKKKSVLVSRKYVKTEH